MMVCIFPFYPYSFTVTERFVADKMFHFTCFNVDPEDDPSVGLINGELAIPGTLLRSKVFDPVVSEVSHFQILTLCGVGC